jgi:hypothetical protein
MDDKESTTNQSEHIALLVGGVLTLVLAIYFTFRYKTPPKQRVPLIPKHSRIGKKVARKVT